MRLHPLIRANGRDTRAWSNTTSKTSFFPSTVIGSGLTIPADYVTKDGTLFYVDIYGFLSTNGTPTFTIEVDSGGTQTTKAATLPNNASQTGFHIEAQFMVYNVALNLMSILLTFMLERPSNNILTYNLITATSTFNTAIANALNVSGQFSTAHRSNAVDVRAIYMKELMS